MIDYSNEVLIKLLAFLFAAGALRRGDKGMSISTKFILTSLIISTAVAGSCKKRRPGGNSELTGAEEYPNVPPLSTLELHKYLKERVDAQAAKSILDDGSNPSEDIWDYYVDHLATNKLLGSNLRNSRDMFGVPLTSLRFPPGAPIPDPCPEVNRLDVNGKPACNSMDNLMRYMWEPKAKGVLKKDPKDWFVNIIPQYYGSNQPAMKRFLREGDIAVYFHPERRGDDPSVVLQWRTTHAATIITRESDGALKTVDTPSGYAKPFNGVDITPFHVFRILPRDYQSLEVANEYGRQIARWGSLAFDKFGFQGNYGVMADGIRRESEIDKFADLYIDAGLNGVRNIPNMYCAWYAWTNLNLGWMRPMSPAGLGSTRYNKLKGDTFDNLIPSHAFGAGDFDSAYSVPTSLQPRMPKRDKYAVMPLTAPELLVAFLDRIVGSTDSDSTPQEFIARAKLKAGYLSGFSQSDAMIKNFQTEARSISPAASTSSSSPTPPAPAPIDPVKTEDAATQTPTNYDALIKKTFQDFAGLYSTVADQVGAAKIDVNTAAKMINDEIAKVIKREWTANLDVSKKWIPPYGFMHHAEYGYEKYNVQEKAQPMMVYVGTVMHEKFLRRKGTQPGTRTMIAIQQVAEKPEDLILDQNIYEKLGCSAANDGNGWKALLTHLHPDPSTPLACGTPQPNLTRMTLPEYNAVQTMIVDWEMKSPPTERDIFVRNSFGLDRTIIRRLLASYWNDPTEYFKPVIYEGESSTIDSAVTNTRILLGDHTFVLNDTPAVQSKYTVDGHPRRQSPLACIAFARIDANATTCRNGLWARPFAD